MSCDVGHVSLEQAVGILTESERDVVLISGLKDDSFGKISKSDCENLLKESELITYVDDDFVKILTCEQSLGEKIIVLI